MNLTIYSEQELKEIQKIELEALRVLTEVCKKMQVEYFVIGGTALGAIRHDGFIPWDDDIDIGMTRENYTKFIKGAAEHLPSQYSLQDPYSSHRTAYPYTKIRVNGTAFVEYSNRKTDMHHGVYIDIFPFDEVPDDDEQNRRQFIKVQRLSRAFVWRQSAELHSAPVGFAQHIKAMMRLFIHLLLQLLPFQVLLDELERVMTQYNGTNQSAMACLLFPRRSCEYGLKTTLFPLKEHLFSGLVVCIPNDTSTYLTTHYGDWKQLPPPEQRFGHKPYYINLRESYKYEKE